MTQVPASSYDHDFWPNQFAEMGRVINESTNIPVPEDLPAPQVNDVPADLRAITDKLNAMLDTMRLRSRANVEDVATGDGGLGDFLEDIRDELGRQGNLQATKGLLVRQTPDGILLIPETRGDDFPVPLPDENVVLLWGKAKYKWVNTTSPDVPYVDCNPSDDKDGTTVDDTRTVRLYLPPQGHGHPNVRMDEIVGYRIDANGDAVCVTSYMDDRIGTVKMWALNTSGVPSGVPGGWHICDGAGGTIDMDAKFPVGHDTTLADADFKRVGTGGGAKTHEHTMTVGETNDEELMQNPWDDWVGIDHSSNVPPFMTLGFIQRVD